MNQQTKYEAMEQNFDRPMSVTLIAILLFLGGGILAVTQLIAFNSLSDSSAENGIPEGLLQGAIAFLGLLGIASGIGAWFGKKWGWWLAIFYFAYAVARNVNTIISIDDVVDQLGAPGQGTTVYYIKYGIRVLWNGLILLFLVRSETVNDYFKTSDTPKWKAVAIVFGIIVLLFVAVTLIV